MPKILPCEYCHMILIHLTTSQLSTDRVPLMPHLWMNLHRQSSQLDLVLKSTLDCMMTLLTMLSKTSLIWRKKRSWRAEIQILWMQIIEQLHVLQYHSFVLRMNFQTMVLNFSLLNTKFPISGRFASFIFRDPLRDYQ